MGEKIAKQSFYVNSGEINLKKTIYKDLEAINILSVYLKKPWV